MHIKNKLTDVFPVLCWVGFMLYFCFAFFPFFIFTVDVYMKSSDAKASKCHLKFSSLMMIFIKLVYLSSVISLKWQ